MTDKNETKDENTDEIITIYTEDLHTISEALKCPDRHRIFCVNPTKEELDILAEKYRKAAPEEVADALDCLHEFSKLFEEKNRISNSEEWKDYDSMMTEAYYSDERWKNDVNIERNYPYGWDREQEEKYKRDRDIDILSNFVYLQFLEQEEYITPCLLARAYQNNIDLDPMYGLKYNLQTQKHSSFDYCADELYEDSDGYSHYSEPYLHVYGWNSFNNDDPDYFSLRLDDVYSSCKRHRNCANWPENEIKEGSIIHDIAVGKALENQRYEIENEHLKKRKEVRAAIDEALNVYFGEDVSKMNISERTKNSYLMAKEKYSPEHLREEERKCRVKEIEQKKQSFLKARELRRKLNPVSGTVIADRIAEDKISGKEKRTITPEVGAEIRKKIAEEQSSK